MTNSSRFHLLRARMPQSRALRGTTPLETQTKERRGMLTDRIAFLVLLLLIGMMMVIPSQLFAAPKANLWSFWNTSRDTNSSRFSHADWSLFLSRYLSECPEPEGMMCLDYSAVSEADYEMLEHYLEHLSRTPVRSLARIEQRAFWINLYNALTVKVVLDYYPTKSIRKIPRPFVQLGPWDDELITVEGQAITLNDIEHRILRPIWPDPRIHYALNCASIGCPNIAPYAFTADNSEMLLNEAAAAFINHPRGVRIHDGNLHLSSIYRWYPEDFGGSERAIISHLRRHAHPELSEQLEHFSRITSYSYDWSLNDTKEREHKR